MTMFFGAKVKRREDPKLISGQGTYVDDISFPGMLHVAMVRSPLAHAKIKKIDVTKAAKQPGVVAIFTAADLKDQMGDLPIRWLVPDLKQPPHRPMSTDNVRFTGDIVAAVVAEDPYLAQDASMLVDVCLLYTSPSPRDATLSRMQSSA